MPGFWLRVEWLWAEQPDILRTLEAAHGFKNFLLVMAFNTDRPNELCPNRNTAGLYRNYNLNTGDSDRPHAISLS